jgi:hypothetical protein
MVGSVVALLIGRLNRKKSESDLQQIDRLIELADKTLTAQASSELTALEGEFNGIIVWFVKRQASGTADSTAFFIAMAHAQRATGRAVRINRQLWKLELANLAARERIEMLPEGALRADASWRVVLANAVAKAMLNVRDGIFLCDGRLAVAGSPDALQELVASCARRSLEVQAVSSK